MNMYTPYRDKMCQKCGKKPYIMFVTNPSNDIAIDPVNEYLCVDCTPSEFFTTEKPNLEDPCSWVVPEGSLITANIKAVELTYNTIFHGKDKKPILSLMGDGKIIVDGEPNEAAKTFLEFLEKSYGSLPQKVKTLEDENKKLKKLCKDLLDCNRCRCGKCLYCESYEVLRTCL